MVTPVVTETRRCGAAMAARAAVVQAIMAGALREIPEHGLNRAAGVSTLNPALAGSAQSYSTNGGTNA